MNEITQLRRVSDDATADLVDDDTFAELAELITSTPPPRRRGQIPGRWRPAIVLLAALAIAAPAVGAVTNWYGLGAPNHPKFNLRDWGFGPALHGGAKVLPLRVPDPQGGPAWGIRIVRVRGGTCEQIGRVENGRIGSLGIDGYWHDDHLFHPYPANWSGQSCGTTGGGGGVAVVDSSANITRLQGGRQTAGCATGSAGTTNHPRCTHGSQRIIIFATFGARATSITYRTPAGTLQTERSPRSQGTFLLVFPLNATTCRRYLQGRLTGNGSCRRDLPRRRDSAGNPFRAAIQAIKLRGGKSIALTASRGSN